MLLIKFNVININFTKYSVNSIHHLIVSDVKFVREEHKFFVSVPGMKDVSFDMNQMVR